MNRIGGMILLAAALFLSASCSPRKEALRSPPQRIEVVRLQLAANHDFVAVTFRVFGGDRL
ncbi:MAG TPA: hypothetical protein VLB08_01520, partial [Candidatus Deferrimicrobium sp.]|nr:hypothetical protein [Candidatus Deferrimicrobium sp.]